MIVKVKIYPTDKVMETARKVAEIKKVLGEQPEIEFMSPETRAHVFALRARGIRK